MISFRDPKLFKQASGDLYIELTEAGTWESFPKFAEALTQQIGAIITERIDGPDVRLWKIAYAGNALRLVYDDYPNGVSIEPSTSGQDAVIRDLFDTFMAQVSPSGV
jgi:hypothetical protein